MWNLETDAAQHLVGRSKLPESIKDWDYSAVGEWPRLLADAGFPVRRGG